MSNNFPKLHNAAWPGVVGKGRGQRAADRPRHDARPDGRGRGRRRRSSTASTCSCSPRTSSIDSTDDDLEEAGRQGSLARPGRSARSSRPVWPPTGGGSAMGEGEGRKQVPRRRSARAAASPSKLRELGIRPYGVVRIDSACGRRPTGLKDPKATRSGSPTRSARPATSPTNIGERLAAEGEICWGGMHSWRRMVELLEAGRPPGDARLPGRHGPHAALPAGLQRAGGPPSCRRTSTGTTRQQFDAAYDQLTAALRPWTIDFHVAQNDATVLGSGSHDKTGRHCLPNDPNGKLDIAKHAGYWLRDELRQRAQEVSATSAGTAACSPTRR